jgi:phenylalanyl-tRNA synthetase alpha chain
LKTLGGMTPEERQVQGPIINGLKGKITDAIAARRDTLKAAALEARLATETIDVSLPLAESPIQQGRIHPISQVMDELTAIFADMGFEIAEGPHIETDDLNFSKLNIPQEHPARAEMDTFYFDEKEDGSRMLLRTHTSPVRSARCWSRDRRSASLRRVVCSAATTIRPTPRCSIRWKGW